MRIQTACWNLNAQEGGLTGWQNIRKYPYLCTYAFHLASFEKKLSFAASDEVQPSEVHVYFVALLLQ